MLTDINPKLPMRDKGRTKEFYIDKLGFEQFGSDYDGYLMVQKDNVQIHFFEFKETKIRSCHSRHILITSKQRQAKRR